MPDYRAAVQAEGEVLAAVLDGADHAQLSQPSPLLGRDFVELPAFRKSHWVGEVQEPSGNVNVIVNAKTGGCKEFRDIDT